MNALTGSLLQLPGGPDVGITLLIGILPPLCVAVLLYFATTWLRVGATEHLLAWSLTAFVAGFANVGLGSVVVVALLRLSHDYRVVGCVVTPRPIRRYLAVARRAPTRA